MNLLLEPTLKIDNASEKNLLLRSTPQLLLAQELAIWLVFIIRRLPGDSKTNTNVHTEKTEEKK